MKSELLEIVNRLPAKPGVYQFFDVQGKILYVGKAKNLRKRVGSYFKIGIKSYKHEALVEKISEVRYILVENESDALLLENNLIKEYQPRYNILLKDDKTYPWICIQNERFPRVFATRNYIQDGSEYFGPYTSGFMVKTLLDLIRRLFPLRSCSLLLCEQNIEKKKFKRCLEFQLGNCKAPCEGMQSEAEYLESIHQVREILKGNLTQVIRYLQTSMEKAASRMQFETAQSLKERLDVLEKFKGKTTIVNPKISNVDVFSIVDDEKSAYINFLKIVQGAIVQAHNIQVVKRTEEEQDEMLATVMFDLRKRYSSQAIEIILPFKPEISIPGVHYTVPSRGDKLKLLQLSIRNATSYKLDSMQAKKKEAIKYETKDRALLQLKEDLRLKRVPEMIECFDNSNIQGFEPVASCVVFRNGKPYKQGYRHFNIKTVIGPNDFASMSEIVFRRYKRIIEEEDLLPDLVIIDGGKGQLGAAVQSLKQLGIYGKVSIIGIAKRLEEIYVPEDPIPIYINKNSQSLRLIQRIRDEAHRFGVTFHRNKRSHSQLRSSFENIPGIGEKTVEKILKVESDVEVLKKYSFDELSNLIGKKAANKLYDFLRNN